MGNCTRQPVAEVTSSPKISNMIFFEPSVVWGGVGFTNNTGIWRDEELRCCEGSNRLCAQIDESGAQGHPFIRREPLGKDNVQQNTRLMRVHGQCASRSRYQHRLPFGESRLGRILTHFDLAVQHR